MPAVAETHVEGVFAREAEAAMRELGVEGLSSTQSRRRTRCGVGRAARLLDEEPEGRCHGNGVTVAAGAACP